MVQYKEEGNPGNDVKTGVDAAASGKLQLRIWNYKMLFKNIQVI